MNKITLLLLGVLLIAIASCGTHKYTVTHDFPAAMAPHIKADYVKQWEKGRVLYGMNCAKCHSTYKGKHEIIPNFTPEKLTGYELRVQNARHEAAMPDDIVSAEDLALITIFLTYKKKN